MGTSCAPWLANAYLLAYESSWVRKHLRQAKQLNDVARYLDDILFLGDVNDFERILLKIYPRTLTLKRTSTTDTSFAFLDLQIDFRETAVTTSLYDKRREFGFDIVNFPDMTGCIPRSIARGVIASQFLRYGLIITTRSEFLQHCRALTKTLLKRGFRFADFGPPLRIMFQRHAYVFFPLGISFKSLMNALFPKRKRK